MALFNVASKLTSFLHRGAATLFARQCFVNPLPIEEQTKQTNEVFSRVNELIAENSSRNFAVIHLAGKQYRITDGDLVAIEGYWPPTIGDVITFDKILLAGTKDFTMVGRPTIQRGLVIVTATVVSKGLTHTTTHFKLKPKKHFRRINFQRHQQSILRINSVIFSHDLNKPSNVY